MESLLLCTCICMQAHTQALALLRDLSLPIEMSMHMRMSVHLFTHRHVHMSAHMSARLPECPRPHMSTHSPRQVPAFAVHHGTYRERKPDERTGRMMYLGPSSVRVGVRALVRACESKLSGAQERQSQPAFSYARSPTQQRTRTRTHAREEAGLMHPDPSTVHVSVCVYSLARVCMRVRACVRACVHACALSTISEFDTTSECRTPARFGGLAFRLL